MHPCGKQGCNKIKSCLENPENFKWEKGKTLQGFHDNSIITNYELCVKFKKKATSSMIYEVKKESIEKKSRCNKIKSSLENTRGLYKREEEPLCFHVSSILFICVMIVKPTDKNNNNL